MRPGGKIINPPIKKNDNNSSNREKNCLHKFIQYPFGFFFGGGVMQIDLIAIEI